jgi:hypothetical protein
MSLTEAPNGAHRGADHQARHHIHSVAATQIALLRSAAATGRTAFGYRRLVGGVLQAGRCAGNGQNDDSAMEDGRRMLGNNATVLPLRDYRAARRTLYFSRAELNQLLGLYSRNVARGIWRDYAIDHRDGQALFSVFRHTHESAAYTIVKSIAPAGREATPGQASSEALFVVLSGRQRLYAAKSLAEALDFFRSRLALVPGIRR